jgi:hypothetical protein
MNYAKQKTRQAMRFITISLYNDITIERYYRHDDNPKSKVSPYTGNPIARMSQQMRLPLFTPFSQIAIAPEIRPCRYTTRLIQRNPTPT